MVADRSNAAPPPPAESDCQASPHVVQSAMDLDTAPVFNMRTFGARSEDQRTWGMKMGMNGFFWLRQSILSSGSTAPAPACRLERAKSSKPPMMCSMAAFRWNLSRNGPMARFGTQP